MLLSILLLAAGSGCIDMPIDTLKPSTVIATKAFTVSSRDTVNFSESLSATESLLSLPGLQVNDYGGFSGLKTLNVRGLGSSHSVIAIDGLRVANVQSGQSDLGMLNVEDFSHATLDYASNSLNFTTVRPERTYVHAAFKGGSFSTYLPSAEVGFVPGSRFAAKASVAGIFSKGNFPYENAEGVKANREGNDIRQIKAGLDFFGGKWHAKAYFNSADRGTPGSVFWLSEDRQKDNNFFVQGSYQSDFGKVYSLDVRAKVSQDNLEYKTSYGDSEYRQGVAMAAIDNGFRLNDWWTATFTMDAEMDRLRSDYQADRLTVRPSVSTSFDLSHFKASASLEYNLSKDRGHASRAAFSPAFQAKWSPLGCLDITGFARRAYRVPTFNELYYIGFGNPDLNPEDAWLTDIGIAYRLRHGKFSLDAGVDGFYNWLQDKIISAPTEADPNIWLPFNVGKVRIMGADANVRAGYKSGRFAVSASAAYSYTNATDRTPDSYSFGNQIAYIPKHSANVSLNVSYVGTRLALIWNSKGGRKDSYGDMPAWNTLDINVFQAIGKHVSLSLHGRNLTNCRYEISSGYPMPGVSILGGIEICF